MPYISKNNDRREKLRNGEPALLAGELNYQIYYYVKHNHIKLGYKITNEEFDNQIKIFVDNFLGEKPNYQRYNDMTGALVRCGREIERRLKIYSGILIGVMNSYDDEIAKYENTKIIENGDVE